MNILAMPMDLHVRAWDEEFKKMYPPIDLSALVNMPGINWGMIYLMLSTGRKDMNGTEIFAGDVLEVVYKTPFGKYKDTVVVNYDKYKCGFIPFVDVKVCDECDNYIEIVECRIISNICENKLKMELLK